LSTVRIPIRFDTEATAPKSTDFVEEVFPEDAMPLACEILGDLLTPDRSIQKASCLVGEGGNGKSAFLDLASNFVGTENIFHLSLQKLPACYFPPNRLPHSNDASQAFFDRWLIVTFPNRFRHTWRDIPRSIVSGKRA
jgi:phage/plasmid-associated DNA primase